MDQLLGTDLDGLHREEFQRHDFHSCRVVLVLGLDQLGHPLTAQENGGMGEWGNGGMGEWRNGGMEESKVNRAMLWFTMAH